MTAQGDGLAKENCRRKLSAIDLTAARLHLRTTKNDEAREFPINALPELRLLLESQLSYTRRIERIQSTVVPWVFDRSGRQIKDLREAWRRACAKVRSLERARVPRSVAMKLTGHKTEDVYRRYAIVDQTALEDGVSRLAQLRSATRRVRRSSASNGNNTATRARPAVKAELAQDALVA